MYYLKGISHYDKPMSYSTDTDFYFQKEGVTWRFYDIANEDSDEVLNLSNDQFMDFIKEHSVYGVDRKCFLTVTEIQTKALNYIDSIIVDKRVIDIGDAKRENNTVRLDSKTFLFLDLSMDSFQCYTIFLIKRHGLKTTKWCYSLHELLRRLCKAYPEIVDMDTINLGFCEFYTSYKVVTINFLPKFKNFMTKTMVLG